MVAAGWMGTLMARPEPDRRPSPEPGRTVDVVRGAARGEFLVRDGDRVAQAYAIVMGEITWVFHNGVVYELAAAGGHRGGRRGAHGHSELTSPMPATVVAINVAAGDQVRKGDILILLEAMKMELPVRAPADGRVEAIHCRPGELVQPDTSLIDLE
jgi:acetyl/propionyl-CoA carboxylase alpha subunit